jgi:hypothetical protein
MYLFPQFNSLSRIIPHSSRSSISGSIENSGTWRSLHYLPTHTASSRSVARVEAKVVEYRRITADNFAVSISTSVGTVDVIPHEDLM